MADPNLLEQHSGKIIGGFFTMAGTILIAVSKWFVGREVKRIDDKFTDHSARLHSLELQVATKDDLREIRETMTSQHGQLLDAILQGRDR